MLDIWMIRHGMTEGNKYGRYIGVTDEPLCEEGKELLEHMNYPEVEIIYVSPMSRCLETAKILYPGIAQKMVGELAECNFGDFENHNYIELSGNQDYQRWVDSNGVLAFPNGESKESFQRRVVIGFQKSVDDCIQMKIKKAAMIVHGGTIMSIMEKYAHPHREYYEWHVKNGEGYHIWIDEVQWRNGEKEVQLLSVL